MENKDQPGLFPPIGVEEEPPVKKELELSPDQAKIKDLEGQIAEQGKKMEKQNDDFMKMLSSRPAPAQHVVQPTPLPPEEAKMPDVLEDPEGYADFIDNRATKKAEKIVNDRTTQLETKYQEDKKYERVFARFKTIDSDVATKNADLVEFIAIKKVKAAAAQGLDVNTFIFGDEERFAQDVINEAKQQLGIVADDDNDRTAGLTTTQTLSTPTAKKPGEQVKGFMDSMKELRYRGR